MPYKPDGHTSVAPYLIVDDVTGTLAFLRAVFGCEPLRVIRGGDDAIVHAEARIDDTVVMLGQMPGGPDAHVHVYVEDVDAVFERALAAGGTRVQDIEDKGDGDRRGGVRDANGTTWWFSTQIDPAD